MLVQLELGSSEPEFQMQDEVVSDMEVLLANLKHCTNMDTFWQHASHNTQHCTTSQKP
jgi:hypothetical protein